MADLIDFDGVRAVKYIERALAGFLDDPADSDHQRGYLSALLTIYTEGLGKGIDDGRIELLRHQARASA